MKASDKCIELIKEYEGFTPNTYYCPAGKLTIGYGHVIQAEKEKFNTKITESDADRILRNDLRIAEQTIDKRVKVILTQGQYDALVSLVFNWGGGNFLNSTGLKFLNQSNYEVAAEEFFNENQGVVRINGQISNGLIRRRKAELSLWCGKA